MRRAATLEGVALDSDAADGIAIGSLQPGTTVVVETRNSIYRFVVLTNRRDALVTGGAMFPEPAVVRIEGATAGGSAIKMGWIVVGYQIELRFGWRRIRTSPVRSLSRE